jgi:tol-pal system beta propeller repeat protein TolB
MPTPEPTLIMRSTQTIDNIDETPMLLNPPAPTLVIQDFRSVLPAVPPGLGEQANHLIFFSNRTGKHQIYQVALDGSGLVQLTNNPERDVFNMKPAWAPDGRIAFTSEHITNSWDVFVLDPDSPLPTSITEWGADSWGLTWSPDGQFLAFASDAAGDDEIYLATLDGGEPVNLTQQPDSSDFFPAWSPDGQQIAFVSDREVDQDIFVMNIDGSGVRRLTGAQGRDTAPNWSPDGTKITFVTERDGNFEVYVMNADGSDPIRLTDNSVYEWSPTWSPDGDLIAFTSTREHYETYDVYIMAPDGSNQTRLTTDPANDIIPMWWP